MLLSPRGISAPPEAALKREIHIVIPFYKNADLVAPLLNSLADCREELRELHCSLSIINDSPEDETLAEQLQEAISRFPTELPCTSATNRTNLGYLGSVNAACQRAAKCGADVVLLNSDTLLYPGVIREMQRVAYLDSMIGFVSPRSNNATICTFPQQRELSELSPDQFRDVFRDVSKYLPEYHYVPTCVGFCLLIKNFILREVGFFDEVYGKGYSEENDLIMRANRLGFRAVLANRAFVYHIGERSFAASDTPKALHESRNYKLLTQRYPEYREHVDAYFKSTHHEAERLLAGLIPDSEGRIDVAFDCSHVGKHHNGTFRHLARVISEASKSWGDRFNVHVLANREVDEFHELTSNPRVFLSPIETNRVFGIAYRLGQPFDFEAFLRMSRLAPINVYAMLDTIAWDCLYLNRDRLDELWRATAQYADGILYNSEFTQRQFRHRFPVRPGMPETASYLSLAPREYVDGPVAGAGASDTRGSYLLLVGNSFAHKYVEPTVKAITRQLPRTKIVALGLEASDSQNVTAYGSGQLSPAVINYLFEGARGVVFPSTYEGFGMPVLEALGHRKVLYVRDNPLNRALHVHLGLTRNLILYDSTENLVSMLSSDDIPEWTDDLSLDGGTHTWATHAEETKHLLERALANFSYAETLLPRLSFAALVDKAGTREMQRRLLEDSSSPTHLLNQQFGVDSILASAEVIPLLEELRSGIAGLKEQRTSAAAEEASRLMAEIKDLRVVIHERESRIGALQSSFSWNVTAPLRAAYDTWLRVFRGKAGDSED